MVCLIFLLIILIICVLVDVTYFLRLGMMFLMSHVFKKQRISIFDTALVRGLCLSRDLGGNCVMNHFKYVKDIQLAIHDFYIRTGLRKVISDQRNRVYVNATSIRHLQPISCFSIYKIKTQASHWVSSTRSLSCNFTLDSYFFQAFLLSTYTVPEGLKLIDWDAHHIYLVHYFTNGCDQILTVALTRQLVLKGTADEVIQPLYDTTDDTDEVEEIALWKEVLESSVNLAEINEDLLRKPIAVKASKRGRSH